MPSSMKSLFTQTYHGELTDGEHKVLFKDFTFTALEGLHLRANVKIFPQVQKALPTDFNYDGRSITFGFDNIAALFSTDFEPEENKDYFTATFITDDGREFRKNLFQRDFAIFLKQTRIQMTGANTQDINPVEWIQSMLGKEISIWITYQNIPRAGGQITRVQNVNYCAPLQLNNADEPTTTEEKPF